MLVSGQEAFNLKEKILLHLMSKPDFTSPDGIKIRISCLVAEMDPPEYTYYLHVNDQKSKEIAWHEICPILESYGISKDQIPIKYKNKHQPNFDLAFFH